MKKIALLLMIALGLFGCSTEKQSNPPNIIFIMSDDHASRAISAYDSSLITTPNIDRLVANGIRFDRCYCTNAICAPSRAVILTGKYSHMNGVVDNSRPFDGSQQTLPKILQQSGYQTAIVGKWHLRSEPTGFDHWLVLPGQGAYYKPDFIGPEGKTAIDGYVTDIITDEAIEFIDQRDPDKPFFLMLYHKAPHRNWQPAMRHLGMYDETAFPIPDNLYDTYEGRSEAAKTQEMSIATHMSLDYDLKLTEDLIEKKGSDRELFFGPGMGDPKSRMDAEDYAKWKAYYEKRTAEYNTLPADNDIIDAWKYQQYMEDYLSCITAVDENIGKLLDYLESSGLSENTIVIYTSDQGFFLGEHGWYDKRFMYDEAHQMPLLISAPGLEKTNDEHMITNADFAPTILSLAGLEVPEDMQGESFHEIIHGESPEQWRESVYYHYFEYPAVHSVKRHYGIRTEKFKLIHYYYDIDAWELYDLEDDPEEMNNLADDLAYADELKSLKEELEKLRIQYEDTQPECFLPAMPLEVANLATGKTYALDHPPSDRYPGKPGGLTDGIAYPDGESYAISRNNWCGFQGDDLIIHLDLGKETEITQISVGFLQNQESWIFLPEEVDFFTSLDGEDFMMIKSEPCGGIVEDQKVMKHSVSATYPAIKTRYIKIHVKNSLIPEWHNAAGKPAWMFVDEIIVLGDRL